MRVFVLGLASLGGGCALAAAVWWVRQRAGNSADEEPSKVLSVNYHLTRQCNYSCKFCFHTATTSFVLPLEDAKRGLDLLKAEGCKKINFSGGEPFITQRGKYLGELCRHSKTIGLATSIISNGSLITREWMQEYGKFVDILGVSCDSGKTETLHAMGREQVGKDHIKSLRNVRAWCKEFGVGFKVNTVVTSLNNLEDMSSLMAELGPMRWKVFQCLLIQGENQASGGQSALRDATTMVVSGEAFKAFCQRHAAITCLVPENNDAMRNSYLILDEYMRFLDNTGGEKKASPSILDVGVPSALDQAGFDEATFFARGGRYEWSVPKKEGPEGCSLPDKLQW